MMANSLPNLESYKKLVALVRKHNLSQIQNTFQFGFHALRNFPADKLPYQPLSLGLAITTRCNLRCAYCPFHGEEAAPRSAAPTDMPMDTYLRILDRFPRANTVAFGEGEPTLHPGLYRMIRKAHDRHMEVLIDTNGTLLDKQIDELLEAPVEVLNLSLYGDDAESFSQLTGASGKLFTRLVAAAEQIVRRRKPGGFPRLFRASFVCDTRNLSQVMRVIRMCEEIGFDKLRLRNIGGVQKTTGKVRLPLSEGDPIAEDFLARLRAEHFRIPVILPSLYRNHYRRPGCVMPFRYIAVNTSGAVGPCCTTGAKAVWGNLFENSDAWNSEPIRRFRRQLADPNRPLPALCRCCPGMLPERETTGGHSRL